MTWKEICGVGAIVETTHPAIHADPSQGSHFFHNIASLGINYFNVGVHAQDRFTPQALLSLTEVTTTPHTVHLRAAAPLVLRVDGRSRLGVILLADEARPRPAA